MIIARWHIEAKFGHKQDVIASLKRWNEMFGAKVGWDASKVRMLTGSIGATEALITEEVELESLAKLHEGFEKLGTLDGHAEWSKEIEPHVVPGSNRWEVFRVI